MWGVAPTERAVGGPYPGSAAVRLARAIQGVSGPRPERGECGGRTVSRRGVGPAGPGRHAYASAPPLCPPVHYAWWRNGPVDPPAPST